MSLSSAVQVHYLNISSDKKQTNSDVYEVDDLSIKDGTEDTVIFSWLISQNATHFIGTLHFAIRFMCTTEEEIDYIWNTKPHTGIIISKGINNSEVVIEDYTDFLAQWTAIFEDTIENTYIAANNANIAKINADTAAKKANEAANAAIEATTAANEAVKDAQAVINQSMDLAFYIDENDGGLNVRILKEGY